MSFLMIEILKFYFAPDPFEMSNSQTSNEDTNESESQNQTEEANQETTAQESDTTDLENDPERVYFGKVYDLLIAQNKLDNPCSIINMTLKVILMQL